MIKEKKIWTRKQRIIFSKLYSFMCSESSSGKRLFFVMLSSGLHSDKSLLTDHHRKLRDLIKKVYGYEISYFQVLTDEGNGVIHAVWSIKTKSKKRRLIKKKWLDAAWSFIHQANITWISNITQGSDLHNRNVAAYLCSQYLANQGDACIIYYCYSWKNLPVSLSSGFKCFKSLVTKKFIREKWFDYTEKLSSGASYPVIIWTKELKKILYAGWFSLLRLKYCCFAGDVFQVVGREVFNMSEIPF